MKNSQSRSPLRKQKEKRNGKANKTTKSIKSQRSAISSYSSITVKSNNKSSLNRNKSIKSNISHITRQQEEEYDRLSASKNHKINNRIKVTNRSKASPILSKSAGRSTGNQVQLINSKNNKTIMIECKGLSKKEIEQIDRITKIINNDGKLKSNKKSASRKRTKSPTKKSEKSKTSGRSINAKNKQLSYRSYDKKFSNHFTERSNQNPVYY